MYTISPPPPHCVERGLLWSGIYKNNFYVNFSILPSFLLFSLLSLILKIPKSAVFMKYYIQYMYTIIFYIILCIACFYYLYMYRYGQSYCCIKAESSSWLMFSPPPQPMPGKKGLHLQCQFLKDFLNFLAKMRSHSSQAPEDATLYFTSFFYYLHV